MSTAEVREVFRSSTFGNIAGVIVRSGVVTRSAPVSIVRRGVVVASGLSLHSLRRFRDDLDTLGTDYEGGLGLGPWDDVQVGDLITQGEVTPDDTE